MIYHQYIDDKSGFTRNYNDQWLYINLIIIYRYFINDLPSLAELEIIYHDLPLIYQFYNYLLCMNQDLPGITIIDSCLFILI